MRVRTGRRSAAAVAVAMVLGSVATAASADPGDRVVNDSPRASADQGKPKKKAPGKDKLGQHDRELLAKAEAANKRRVTVMVATENGQTAAALTSLKGLGAQVRTSNAKLGYVSASLPTGAVVKAAGLGSVLAVDLDEVIPREEVRVDAGKTAGAKGAKRPAATYPGPSKQTPDDNPYLPTNETGSVAFKDANPTWDGRGITVGIMDSGVDLDHPALQKTSTGERKIVDWVTATDPLVDGDATWRAMLTSVQGATATYAGSTWTLPNSSTSYRINRFSEAITAGSEPGGDVNRDGDTTDVFGVLFDPATNDIWVDANQNRTFEASEKMRPYKEKYDVGHFGDCSGVTSAGEKTCMPFTVEFRKKVSLAPAGLAGTADFVNIGIVEDAHGSHVAGIATGHSLFGGAMDGQAPGAKIVSSRACSWGGGCTAVALLDGMVDLATNRGVDIINMSIGGLPALNDANNSRAVVYDRIVNQLGVQLVISAGNSGAGLNTIGDPSVATDVISVASSVSKETWAANYGSQVSAAMNLHNYSSRGPREDGGFKPNVSAPGSAVSTVPQWLKQPDLAEAGYTLPIGYAHFNGTSMASPQAAGASALLLSAAKATGRMPTTKALRESIYSSAKQIDGVSVVGQGTGLFDVRAAWRKLSANPTINASYAVDAPVCTPISGFLKVPNRGTGVYNRCGADAGGQVVGVTKYYDVTVTRTAGADRAVWHNVSMVGNDGTFSTVKRISLPLNQPTQLRIAARTTSVGAHSMYVVVDDPRTSLQDLRIMATVVSSDTPAAPASKVVKSGSVERNRYVSYFVNVPAGVDALQVNSSGLLAGSQVRWVANNPYGVPVDTTTTTYCYANYLDGNGCNPTSRSYANPIPGVWEFVVEARRTSPQLDNPFTLSVRLQGATVTPALQTLESVTQGVPSPVQWTVRNDLGPITLTPQGGPLGSASSGKKTIADGDSQEYTVEVPAGAAAFTATIGNTSDLGADLDLTVFRDGTQVGQSADGDSEESVTLRNPAAGTYTVVVDGYAVPAGTTTYDYLDVFTSPALGTLTVTSAASVPLDTLQSTTVTGAITAQAVPQEGRQLFGEMRAVTSEGAVLGTGKVVVTTVTAP